VPVAGLAYTLASGTHTFVILSGAKDLSTRSRLSRSDICTLLQTDRSCRGSRYLVAVVSRRRKRAALLYKMSRFSSGVRYSAF
jgi:hypothetical protein